MLLVALLLSCVSSSFAQKKRTPIRFEDFATAETLTGSRAVPVLRTKLQREFRSRILDGAKLPPNFAGHYRIVQWGCGSDCVDFVTVDLNTGDVYDPPFNSLWVDAFTERWRGEGLIHKVNSRLLVPEGCPSERCGRFYYEWTGHDFKLLTYTKKAPQWDDNGR